MRNIELVEMMEEAKMVNKVVFTKDNPYDDDYYKMKRCCLADWEDNPCDYTFVKKTVYGLFLNYKDKDGKTVSALKKFCPKHWLQWMFGYVDTAAVGTNPVMSPLDCDEGIAP